MLNSYRLAITEIIAWPKHTSQTRHCSRLFRLLVFPDFNVDHFEDYNLGQNKWNIWTTPPPISMMRKWRVVAPSCLHHCFGGKGENCSISSVQDCRLSRMRPGFVHVSVLSQLILDVCRKFVIFHRVVTVIATK